MFATSSGNAQRKSCRATSLLQQTPSGDNSGAKTTAYNIFPVSVDKNAYLEPVKNARPTWSICQGTTHLGLIGDVKYLADTNELAYYFDCNSEKNNETALCKSGAQQCISTECVLQLNDKLFCLWIEGADGAYNYGINENSCFADYAPKTAADINADLATKNPDKSTDSQLSATVGAIQEVHRLNGPCKTEIASQGPVAMKSSAVCLQLQNAKKTLQATLASLHQEFQKEKPEKQVNLVQREQASMDKLKEQAVEFQKEIDRKNKIAASLKKTQEQREQKIEELIKRRKKYELEEGNVNKKESQLAEAKKAALVAEARATAEKRALIQQALAKELEAKELESLGRKKDEQKAKTDLANMMEKSDKLKNAIDTSESKLKLAAAETKRQEKKYSDLKKNEMLLEKQRLEEIKTYKESQKEALKQELSLRQRKYQMEDKLQELQGDVATLEGKLLASGKKPSKHSMYDVSDIDSKYQEQAKKKMESMVHAYGNVLTSQVPPAQNGIAPQMPGSLPAVVPDQQPKQQNINIVIGCGKNCNKKEDKKEDRKNSLPEGKTESAPKVQSAVKSAIKKVMADRAAEDADMLERRRLELEHDQRVQEQAAQDVKKALDEKRDAEDRVQLLKARLNQQKSEGDGVKSELAREKAVSQVDKQKAADKAEKLRDLAEKA